MKKLKFLLLLGLSLLFDKAKGQAYIPLAIDSAQWVIAQDDVETPYYIDNLFGYRINGDTVINGYKYKKVYSRSFTSLNGDYFPPYIVHEGSLFGVVRDSVAQEKVYAIRFDNWATSCPTNEEYLMYDFSLNIGDSIEGLCQIMGQNDSVTQVYQQYFAGEIRRHWQMSVPCVQNIEGVGSTQGLFETPFCGLSGWDSFLYLYCQGSDEQCLSGFLANVDDISEQQNVISVYPNPVKNIINIKKKSSDILSYIIYNIFGKVVLKGNIKSSDYQIDISELSQGLYFLSINLQTFKIIKL